MPRRPPSLASFTGYSCSRGVWLPDYIMTSRTYDECRLYLLHPTIEPSRLCTGYYPHGRMSPGVAPLYWDFAMCTATATRAGADDDFRCAPLSSREDKDPGVPESIYLFTCLLTLWHMRPPRTRQGNTNTHLPAPHDPPQIHQKCPELLRAHVPRAPESHLDP